MRDASGINPPLIMLALGYLAEGGMSTMWFVLSFVFSVLYIIETVMDWRVQRLEAKRIQAQKQWWQEHGW